MDGTEDAAVVIASRQPRRVASLRAGESAVLTARVFSWIGVLIVLVGIIDLIWTQIATPTLAADSEAYVRWEIAGSALTLIALGVLICIAARVLDQIARRALSG